VLDGVTTVHLGELRRNGNEASEGSPWDGHVSS
jgi:hypothetical protein